MKTCTLNDFMEEIKPWLSRDYIRQAYRDDQGNLVLHFLDGVRNVYRIDDCTAAQLKRVLAGLKKKGITVVE